MHATAGGMLAESILRVSEFKVLNNDKADRNSEIVILEVPNPQFNHNGGDIQFGPDGYLYISIGDGGARNDNAIGHTGVLTKQKRSGKKGVLGNSQDTQVLLGKILRIDVDRKAKNIYAGNYSIPIDNPFVKHKTARGEIYHMGLRNAWRFTFDSKGNMYSADVGQGKFEMVFKTKSPSNMGWRMYEAGYVFDQSAIDKFSNKSPLPLIKPIAVYAHPNIKQSGVPEVGTSITGGYVYTGKIHPELQGRYIFGDWSDSFIGKGRGRILMLNSDNSITKLKIKQDGETRHTLTGYLQGIGKGQDGELYFFIAPATKSKRPIFDAFNGKIYKLVP